MFQIYDGSMEFTQWDQGQKVTCDRMDAGDKVVFINFSGATYVMEAYAEGGTIVADVPNKLLQYASPIVIDLQDQPCQYTRIGVNASEKPEDYEFVDNAWVEKEDRPASGGSAGGGIPMAIIKNSNYDNVLAGIATAASAPAASYACENMTFDEAMSILMSGKPLMALIMDVAGEAPMVGVAYYARLDVWGETPCIHLGWDQTLYWTADEISTEDPN